MSDNRTVVRTLDGRTFYLDEHNNTVQDANGVNIGETRELGIANVHLATTLGNYCAGYKLADGIADFVAPPVPTDKASDYYTTWDKDDAFQGAHTQLVGEAAPLPEITPRLSSTLFSTAPYGLATFVPQGVIANADNPINPRMGYLRRIMNAMAIGREQRAAALLMSGTTFSGYTANVAAGAKWNGGATSDPIADLHSAIKTALMPITDIIMSEEVAFAFVTNPNVAKYVQYKSGVDVDGAAISSILKLPPITISKHKTKSNTTGLYGYTWGRGCLLIHREPGVTIDGESISTAKTFRWRKGGLGNDASGFRVRMWFDPAKGQDGGEYIAVCTNEVVTATAPATGYYLGTCYQ